MVISDAAGPSTEIVDELMKTLRFDSTSFRRDAVRAETKARIEQLQLVGCFAERVWHVEAALGAFPQEDAAPARRSPAGLNYRTPPTHQRFDHPGKSANQLPSG